MSCRIPRPATSRIRGNACIFEQPIRELADRRKMALQARVASSAGLAGRIRIRTTPAAASRAPRSSRLACKAVLESTVAEAVTQQATAFAIVLAAEGLFSRNNVPESDKGRPAIPQVAAGAGGSLVAAALISQGNGGLVSAAGLVLGFVVAGAMIVYNSQRFTSLQFNDGDWPGPKAWPASMAVISFFAVCAYVQALVADVSTSV